MLLQKNKILKIFKKNIKNIEFYFFNALFMEFKIDQIKQTKMINKRVDNKNIKILEDIFIYNIKGIN